MSSSMRFKLVFIGIIVTTGLCASCANEGRVPAVRKGTPGETPGVSPQQAKMAHRAVAPQAAGRSLDAGWYAGVGRPRILVLFNRQFAGDEETWRTDWRVVVTKQGGEAKEAGDAAAETKTTNERDVIQAEPRSQEPSFLSLETSARLRTAFLKPFLSAGCQMVDPGTVERTAGAAGPGPKGSQASPETINVTTETLAKEVDWIIEVIAMRSGHGRSQFFLSAKVVDLKSRRILSIASTHDMAAGTRLPGAVSAPEGADTIEDQAEWLAKEVALQAPGAESGK